MKIVAKIKEKIVSPSVLSRLKESNWNNWKIICTCLIYYDTANIRISIVCKCITYVKIIYDDKKYPKGHTEQKNFSIKQHY